MHIEEHIMGYLIAIQTTVCLTLALLAVSAFCSSTSLANAMRAIQHHGSINPNSSPNVLRPILGSTVFDRAVEVWKISGTNTSKLSSEYLGIGCNTNTHLGSRLLPPRGNLPPRIFFAIDLTGHGHCIQVQPAADPFHTISLKCNPNQCETNSIVVTKKLMTAKAPDIWTASQNSGPVSWKFDVLGRINHGSDMVKINLKYSDSSNKIQFNIVNATLTYTRNVYFCKQDQECIPDFVAIRSLNDPSKLAKSS